MNSFKLSSIILEKPEAFCTNLNITKSQIVCEVTRENGQRFHRHKVLSNPKAC